MDDWNLGADVNLNMIVDKDTSVRLGVVIFISIAFALIISLFVYGRFIR
jgi:hypothetical protein